MLSVKIDITDNLTSEIKRLKKEIKQLPKDAIVEYKKLTPIRTGNARSRTVLHGTTIEANYPYAEALDAGHSNQAPDGMTVPFERWLEKEVKKIFRK
jgi:hypothetical protein